MIARRSRLIINEISRNKVVVPIFPGDRRHKMWNLLVKTLGKTGFKIRLIFCIQRVSEIKMTYLDKKVPEFKEKWISGPN